jgi:outer membrane protein assembly factor BamA
MSANFELVGAEILAMNKGYNAIFDKSDEFQIKQGVGFSQFAKVELDLRHQKQFASERSFAARFNIGAALPFGYTTDVPYVKQFFVGGANSMRAWAPRGLGPGGYQDPLADDPANNFRLFQTGDFKMEMNAEYRFPILLWFKGAAFVDVGNIWTFQPDAERPGAEFSFRRGDKTYPFYKELAVAGGLGLRVDLSFFIFRFDVGMKLRYNAPVGDALNPPESAWWNDFRGLSGKDLGLNLGLGFPF